MLQPPDSKWAIWMPVLHGCLPPPVLPRFRTHAALGGPCEVGTGPFLSGMGQYACPCPHGRLVAGQVASPVAFACPVGSPSVRLVVATRARVLFLFFFCLQRGSRHSQMNRIAPLGGR